MGFGFNLFFIFILVPLSGILLILWLSTRKVFFGKLLGLIGGGILALVILSLIVQFFTTKKRVVKEDIYGEYIIDRTKFAGKQADWQYEHFRFEITRNNQFLFHQTNGKQILKTDTAQMKLLTQYRNNRIRITKNPDMHHIIEEAPTLYREVWSFYYVFNSPKFGNVFFRKGQWTTIKQ